MKNTGKSIIITTWPSSTTRSSPPGSTRAARARWPIIDAVENFCPDFDHSRDWRREMHDVFIVISESWEGAHIVRTVYAASEDDARQTHHENYADDTIVAVHQ
jgi:hypothetical protein